MNKKNPLPYGRRTFVLFSAGIVAAITAGGCGKPTSPNTDADSPPKVAAADPFDAKAAQEEAWRRIQPHLLEADTAMRKESAALVDRINAFFESRKAGANAFAQAALGWESKWKLITSRDEHRDFIEKRFSEHLFREEELTAFLKQAAHDYEQSVKAGENDLLVKIRADLADIPAVALPAFSNDSVLQDRFNAMVRTIAADVAKDLQIGIGREIASFTVGEVLATVFADAIKEIARRMGVSAAILAVGGSASWATMGAGLVIAVVVDALLDLIMGWFHDPVVDLESKVSASLTDIGQSITSGDPEAWKIRNCIGEMAGNHTDPAIRTRSAEVLASMENGGALGFRHALDQMARFQSVSRRAALEKLVFEETSQ